ncbi:hypothetical protein BO71DRAFT_423799 [Aspergillus ellipticus CBS 707.79]|uniref:NAD(P)-binding protein n=1 Tax=Aspergillus ellipticus CBS 707.79 TaxID=1448320 RepID=A0A319EB04_9EURO|nr:hypothetical protein BO71DRAFT_423799 [Aspergillus ellipticus CBS 707.79]
MRDDEKAPRLAKAYPNIRAVKGNLNVSDTIEEEVKHADIVFQIADCDHVGAAKAIAKGAAHHPPDRPCWVRKKVYGDWDGVHELLNLPDDAYHRDVEKVIIEAGRGDPSRVKTVIVSPLTVYGVGRGYIKKSGIQVELLCAAVLQRQKKILVGESKNVWSQVHVQDLSEVFLALGEAAAAGGGSVTWEDKGYYLADNGDYVWGDVERAAARVAFEKGLIPSDEVLPFDESELTSSNLGYVLFSWGSNSRSRGVRTRKLLGWEPKKPLLVDSIPDIFAAAVEVN